MDSDSFFFFKNVSYCNADTLTEVFLYSASAVYVNYYGTLMCAFERFWYPKSQIFTGAKHQMFSSQNMRLCVRACMTLYLRSGSDMCVLHL